MIFFSRFHDALNLLFVASTLLQSALAQFPPSDFDIIWEREVEKDLQVLDFTLSGLGGSVKDNLLTSIYLDGPSLLEAVQYAQQSFAFLSDSSPSKTDFIPKCTVGGAQDPTFGIDGYYTEYVCPVSDALETICDEEEGCDKNLIPTIVPAKGSHLRQTDAVGGDAPYLAWALCTVNYEYNNEVTPENPSGCQLGVAHPEDTWTLGANFLQTMFQYQQFIDDANGTEYNLLTYENEVNLVANAKADPWMLFPLGDGRFNLIERVYANETFRIESTDFQDPRPPIWPKLDTIVISVHALVQQYAFRAFADDMENEFFHDVMLGFFLQRHGETIFTGYPETYRGAIIEGAQFKYRTQCALPLGAMVAHYCGYEAQDMKDFMTWFFANSDNLLKSTTAVPTNFYIADKVMCGGWSRTMWQLTKRAMRYPKEERGVFYETPIYNQTESGKMGHSFCDKRVFRFR